jgi:hypothetical protein
MAWIGLVPRALDIDGGIDDASDIFCGRLRRTVACKASLQMDREQLRRRSKMMCGFPSGDGFRRDDTVCAVIDAVGLARLCRRPNYAEQQHAVRTYRYRAGSRFGIVYPFLPHTSAKERTISTADYLIRSRLFQQFGSGPYGQ